MSKQRKKHCFLVICEEAIKTFRRGIPYSAEPVWVDYSMAVAYRRPKKPGYVKGPQYHIPWNVPYWRKGNPIAASQLRKKRWK